MAGIAKTKVVISDNRGTEKQNSKNLSLSNSGTSEKGNPNGTFDATRRRRDESSLISTLEGGKEETPTRKPRRKHKHRSKYRKKDIFTLEQPPQNEGRPFTGPQENIKRGLSNLASPVACRQEDARSPLANFIHKFKRELKTKRFSFFYGEKMEWPLGESQQSVIQTVIKKAKHFNFRA